MCKIVNKKDIYGFRNDKYYRYVKLVFNNLSTLNKSKYIFKHPVIIDGVNSKPMKYKLYESGFEPFLRFCHIKDIKTADWVKVKNYRINNSLGKTDICIEINDSKTNSGNIVPINKVSIANFLQASWDIEVYSFDGEFPDPKKKNNRGEYPNVIYQMATTFKYFNDSGVLVKHLLTLKESAPIYKDVDNTEVIVEYIDSEAGLIKRWIDLMSKMDPDIIYTYNGDSFDWMYLSQRCELLGLTDYLFKNMSRLHTFDAEIKKEFFSSSAYGDNEYNRVYIPGRLNYDLMIHYKRGIKKYSSYKLDSIAYEVLKENKHEVSAKDIFKYYEDGCPEKIKKIALYCIQDTHLLQKLVDKQMILITIIQLANVTFVPIGFLVTRGQTIKVMSQILRKARQMEFLVPNTNFNEDTFPVAVKLQDDGGTTEIFKVGDFLKLNIKTKKVPSIGDDMLNCKVSEIIDEHNMILLTSVELTQPYYRTKLIYNGRSICTEKIWSVNELIDDSFTGACVLEPIIGFTNDDVAVLDFASLYPTIIISRNLCYSTFLLDDKFANCDDTKYETIAWNDSVEYKLNHNCGALMKTGKKKNECCGKQAYFDVDNNYFCRVHDPLKKSRDTNEKYQKKSVDYSYTIVQPSNDNNGNVKHKGVLPSLLEELYAERKAVKKRMAIANDNGDKILADILDCSQQGIKISLNSIFGFLGRKQGNMVLKELGSIVTAVGRTLIETSRDYAENGFIDHIKEHKVLNHKLTPQKIDHFTKEQKEELLKCYLIKSNKTKLI